MKNLCNTMVFFAHFQVSISVLYVSLKHAVTVPCNHHLTPLLYHIIIVLLVKAIPKQNTAKITTMTRHSNEGNTHKHHCFRTQASAILCKRHKGTCTMVLIEKTCDYNDIFSINTWNV